MKGPARFEHQTEGTEFMVNTPKCILADSPGLGKTAQVIDLITKAGSSKTLIIVPNSLKTDWEKALDMFASAEIGVTIVRGTFLQREASLKYRNYLYSRHVYIINYEAVRLHTELLTSEKYDLIACDEAHKLKNREAKVTKALRTITRLAKRLVFMTGTPITRGTIDLFTLLNMIDSKSFSSYWRFVERFCERKFNGFAWEVTDIKDPDDDRLIALREELAKYFLRRTYDTVFPDFVGLHVTKKYIDLTDSQAKIYKQLKKEMLTKVGGSEVVVTNPLALLTRLKQVLLDPRLMTGEVNMLEGAKVDALVSLLHELDGAPVVVFTQFASAIRPLVKTLETAGISAIEYSGQISDKQAQVNESAWKAGMYQVLIAGIDKGGIGKTWTRAQYAVMLDKKWLPHENEQARKRVHRIGQDKPVTIWEFIVTGTIEDKIEKVLAEREDVFTNVITETMLMQLLRS